jgi:hypothetical protein
LNPKVAFSRRVIVVQQSYPGVWPLWYKVGWPNNRTIYWGDSQWGDGIDYDRGENPAVAYTEGASIAAIEVHQAVDGVGPLWYHFGKQ